MDTEISYDKYLMLLAEKKLLFTDHNETTLCLKQSLEGNDDTNLKACLEKRHRTINCIEGIDRSIANEIKNFQNKTGIFRNAEIKSLQKDIIILMDKSSIIEKECMALLKTERNAIKNEVLGNRMKHRRNIGYQHVGSGSVSAKYIDTNIR